MKAIIAAIMLTLLGLSQVSAASAINVSDGWHTLRFSEVAGTSGSGGPYTFTASTPVVITLVDDGYDSEAYDLYDGGIYVASTSVPGKTGLFVLGPDSTLASPQVSQGQFTLESGTHSLNVKLTSTGPGDVAGSARAYLRVDTLGSQPLPPAMPVQFASSSSFNVGVHPISIAGADFNRDGNLDVATANDSTENLSISLGDGNGGFTLKTNYTIGTVPQGVAAGDFDGDSIPDLVATRVYGNVAILLRGLGDGNFAPATYQGFNASAAGGAVIVADFNNDKKLDFAAAMSPNGFTVGLGATGGAFSSAVPRFMNSDRSVAVGDFNGDGKLDAAVPYSSGKYVSIVLGNGDGTFGTATNFSVPSSLSTGVSGVIALADLNQDGNMDMVVAEQATTNDVTVFLGNGTGSFTVKTNYGHGFQAVTVALSDLNGDKNPDLVLGSGANVYVMLGNGDGSFGARVSFPVANGVEALTIADFDNDGEPDIVSANMYGTISVLLNQTFPKLRISATTNQTVLTWPASAVGFQLQVSTNCISTNSWVSVSKTPTVIGSLKTLTNSTDVEARFYRLKK